MFGLAGKRDVDSAMASYRLRLRHLQDDEAQRIKLDDLTAKLDALLEYLGLEAVRAEPQEAGWEMREYQKQ